MVFPFPVYNNTCTFHSLVLPCSNTLHLLVIYLFATLSTLCSCNNNNNVHLLCAYQCPERSHHTYSLNTIFYTYVEDTPTKTIYIRQYMETHTHTHTYCCTIETHCSILVVVSACHSLSNVQVYSVPAFHSLYRVLACHSLYSVPSSHPLYLVPTECTCCTHSPFWTLFPTPVHGFHSLAYIPSFLTHVALPVPSPHSLYPFPTPSAYTPVPVPTPSAYIKLPALYLLCLHSTPCIIQIYFLFLLPTFHSLYLIPIPSANTPLPLPTSYSLCLHSTPCTYF